LNRNHRNYRGTNKAYDTNKKASFTTMHIDEKGLYIQ